MCNIIDITHLPFSILWYAIRDRISVLPNFFTNTISLEMPAWHSADKDAPENCIWWFYNIYIFFRKVKSWILMWPKSFNTDKCFHLLSKVWRIIVASEILTPNGNMWLPTYLLSVSMSITTTQKSLWSWFSREQSPENKSFIIASILNW